MHPSLVNNGDYRITVHDGYKYVVEFGDGNTSSKDSYQDHDYELYDNGKEIPMFELIRMTMNLRITKRYDSVKAYYFSLTKTLPIIVEEENTNEIKYVKTLIPPTQIVQLISPDDPCIQKADKMCQYELNKVSECETIGDLNRTMSDIKMIWQKNSVIYTDYYMSKKNRRRLARRERNR